MRKIKIYFAGKFDLSPKGQELYQRLTNDYRSHILGDSKKLTYADSETALKNYPVHYKGCFYCEQASNGDYTSTDCEVVVREETKAIMEADIFCCVFDLDFSVGTIVELMDAAFAKKRIAIFYKNESSDYAIKSDYWFAIARALEICRSKHTIIEVFGYNDNVLPTLYSWLNNLVFTKRYVCIGTVKLNEYLKKFTIKEQYHIGAKQITYYELEGNKLIVERYKNGLTILKTSEAIHNKGLVDVTDNKLYSDLSIENGNIMVSNAIIEGTDGVGKTVTITHLIHQGIVCKDRSETICRYMLFDVSMEDRCIAYRDYLENNTADFVIFLTNDSKEELELRVKERGDNIGEFDKMAYEYNALYKNTYFEMLKYELNNPIELIDCTGLSLKEQVEKVKNYILGRNGNNE